MAETASGGVPTLSQEAGQRAAELRVPEATVPSGDAGQPIAEPPPIVEPIGFDEPFEPHPVETLPVVTRPIETRAFEPQPVEMGPGPISQRPVRRRFLAPVANGGSGVERSMPYESRPRIIDMPSPSRIIETPRVIQPSPAEAAAPLTEPPSAATATTDAPPPRWRSRRMMALQLGLLVLLIGVVALSLRPKPGDAEADLAQAIKFARGDKQDYTAAAKWFRAAAEKGLPRAQYDLGVLYERGRGVPLDYAQAVMWYKRAAEGNYPLAEYNLAVAYSKGEGIERNLFEAAVWYNRAALQGVVAAMVNLAILYERGEGVQTSPAAAYAWYRAAARRGSQPAARRADELLQAFSAWDQTQAEAKTREVALSIQDSVGESARVAAQAKPATVADGAGSNLKSGFDKETAAPPAAPQSTGQPTSPAETGDMNP